MRRISSRSTFFYKRIFPVFWFGFLVLFIGISLFTIPRSNPVALLPFLIVPIAMMGFGYFFMKNYVFDLVDEVLDDGGALVVRNNDQEQRIALADITNVSYAAMTSPPRVVLSLRHPTLFGDQVAFCAPVQIMMMSQSPVIADLIKRVEQARESRHRR